MTGCRDGLLFLSSLPWQDIVTESSRFDLVSFIPLLRERIYSNNQYARQFIISWVSVVPLLGFCYFEAALEVGSRFSLAPFGRSTRLL